jgi:4a-hydroxytetrahydrobiopterin dehydratase
MIKRYEHYVETPLEKAPKGWEEVDNSIKRNFEFDDFREAMRFVNRIAMLSNQIDHHPDLFLHDYSNVEITYKTHDEGNVVTSKDYNAADMVNDIYHEILYNI